MGFLNCVSRVQSPRKFDEHTSWNVKFSISLMSAPAKKKERLQDEIVKHGNQDAGSKPITSRDDRFPGLRNGPVSQTVSHAAFWIVKFCISLMSEPTTKLKIQR